MTHFQRFLSLAFLALGLALGLAPLPGHAAEFPEKPVRIVVPFPPVPQPMPPCAW